MSENYEDLKRQRDRLLRQTWCIMAEMSQHAFRSGHDMSSEDIALWKALTRHPTIQNRLGGGLSSEGESEGTNKATAIWAGAEAIANTRAGRCGAPPIKNPLSMLPLKLQDEVLEDAEAALGAILNAGT